jgi:hypothetical protein
MSRGPLGPCRVSVVSSAIRQGGVSPMGEALPMLPPKVPTLRIWREPIRWIRTAKDG